MSFVTIFALAIAALVAAPYLAHRLRRQRADERPFAPARLVPPSLPKARRRSRLEDRTLFSLRAASIVALALLGASPLVHCSRLAMSRSGTSVAVAIVLDDSMSMRAEIDGASRFEAAKRGAREVLASLREGDAAAIVYAGSPARVGLAATTDIGAAKVAVESAAATDRATDLDGAIAIAKTLIAELPQVDRRIVVLSDRADGNPNGPPLGADAGLPVWVAMPELAGPVPNGDCAVLSADRLGGHVRARFACSSADAAKGREVRLEDGTNVVAHAPLPSAESGEISLAWSGDDTRAETRDWFVALSGRDAIAADDRAPVVVESGPAAIAVVNATRDAAMTTGGAPIVEQALAALRVDLSVRPVPQIPDRTEDMTSFAAMLVEDPPGLTPEQRRALAAYVDQGGVLLFALGPAAASAPLGANFEPFLARAVAWTTPSPAPGVGSSSVAPFFGESLPSLEDLAPRGRTRLADDDVAAYEHLLDWSDGAPLLARRPRGRGEIWITTLPFSIDESDFALRPGFLALLEGFVRTAKERAAVRRSDVGSVWTFAGARTVEAVGPRGPLTVERSDGAFRLTPELAGLYALTVDGKSERRVAAPIARELDLRPRTIAPASASAEMGGTTAKVDVSWVFALVLLALVAVELVVRARPRARDQAAA